MNVLAQQIADAVDAHDFGKPTAVKRGRNPKYPYVPIVDHSDARHQETEQILGRAYADRADAIAQAEAVIEARRQLLAEHLSRPQYRALREAHGLPREITP